MFGLVSSFVKLFGGAPKPQDEWSARFAALGYHDDTLANLLLAVVVGSTVELSQGMLS